MHKNFDLKSTKIFHLMREEARVWISLERALEASGVEIESDLIDHLIQFSKSFLEFTNWLTVGSKREMENKVNYRVKTIRRLIKLIATEEPIVDDFLFSDSLNRQIQIALIEKASIIFARSTGRDVRETHNVDIELLKILNNLRKKNITKPYETLACAIEKSGILKDFPDTRWSARTIQNRISRVSLKKNKQKVTNIMSPIEIATQFLKQQIPEFEEQIEILSKSLESMGNNELYVIVPYSSKFIYPKLFLSSTNMK